MNACAIAFVSQIIRDIQLMVLVAGLILVDIVVLTAWQLTDPVRCSRSVSAAVKVKVNCEPLGLTSKICTAIFLIILFLFFIKVMERDVSYSLLQLDTCSSLYSDLWLIIIGVQKVTIICC